MRAISQKINNLVKSSLREQRGFTLVEVLVVVALLGIMAGIAIPQLNSFITWGDDEANDTELHAVQTAVTALMADTNSDTIVVPAAATANMTEIYVVTGVMTVDTDGDDIPDADAHATAADYMTGLVDTDDDDIPDSVTSGNTYACSSEGVVTKG